MTEPGRYTRLAMLLHWLIALFIVVNVLLIWTVDYAPEPDQRPMIDLHKSIGITVLGLAIMRLLWRFTHKPPAFPVVYKKWERVLAHGAHIVLYLLIFCLPLTGWLHDSAWKDAAAHPLNLYWVIPWFRLGFVSGLDPAVKEQLHGLFGAMHTSLAYVLYAMYVLHVGGALKHQFFDKERELQRMLPFGKL